MSEVALFAALPSLSQGSRMPWAALGEWPTPVQALPALGPDIWVKRDDLSGVAYGGNKVRTLEALFGAAQAAGAQRIWAVGAFGSNHALATTLHAPRAGLEPAVMLFPQPPSACARENLVATLSRRPVVRPLLTWASVPFAMLRARWEPRSYVMLPGGATPVGALGYVSAALELAGQVAAGALPAPRHIVVGVGSTCTSAGLLAGTAIAARLGLWRDPPRILGVRVTPWPVTSAWRIVSLAVRAAALVARLAGDERLAVPRAELAARLGVAGGFIGRGYGFVTEGGLAAMRSFADAGGPPLDTCYSAKAAAGMLARRPDGPVVFWATKSSRPLPDGPLEEQALASAPPRMARWLRRPV